jgi:hypothetical protein
MAAMAPSHPVSASFGPSRCGPWQLMATLPEASRDTSAIAALR